MPSFEYQAINAAGTPETGTVLGITITDAIDQLSRKGLKVEKINVAQFLNDPLAAPPPVQETPAANAETAAARPSNPYEKSEEQLTPPPPLEPRSYIATNVVGPVVGKVPISQLMFFFRQFGTMLDAGVPLVQTLETLSGQGRDPRLNHIVKELKGHVLEGRPISAGLQRYPEVFTPLQVSMIRAGEEGGFLPSACKQLAGYLEQEIRIRNAYKRALFMPKLTVYGSIFIIGAANWFIGTYTKGATIWSPLTEWRNWIILGPILIGLFLFFKVGLSNPAIRYQWDAFILKVPYIGNTLKQFAMAKFGRAFGALYAGGVPVHRCMELAGDACGNEYLRAQIHPAGRKLKEGSGLTETFTGTQAFTPIVMDMVHAGETTGNVDQMLTKVSEYYEDEAEVRSQQLGKIMGVVAIVLVAIYVLIILVKFYTGYFNSMLGSASAD